MGIFDHPATGGNRGGADHLKGRCTGARDPIGEDELDRFFNANPAPGHALVLQTLNELPVRAFVFFPSADIGIARKWRVREQLPRTILLKRRADNKWPRLRWNDQCPQPLSPAELDVGEISRRCTTGEHDSVNFLHSHQLPGPFQTDLALTHCERPSLARHGRERSRSMAEPCQMASLSPRVVPGQPPR